MGLCQLIGDEGTDPKKYCIKRIENNCIICAASYLDGSWCKTPKKAIRNCLEYQSENKCQKCAFGYKLSDNEDECEKITIPYCILITNNYDCLACDKGIKIVNNRCNPHNKIDIEHCLIYSGNSYQNLCVLCEEGYTVKNEDSVGSFCVKENQQSENCWYQKEQSGKCETCLYNYFMDDDFNCKKSDTYHIELFGFAQNLTLIISYLLVLLF
jgi:hypothetical protein